MFKKTFMFLDAHIAGMLVIPKTTVLKVLKLFAKNVEKIIQQMTAPRNYPFAGHAKKINYHSIIQPEVRSAKNTANIYSI